MVNTLRKGTFDLAKQASYLEGVSWHQLRADLSICSTSTTTGDRLVVTKQSNVPLIDAVVASCAVPAVMRPVTINNATYVDGAVSSPTNADVVLSQNTSRLAVIISPLSGNGARTLVGRATAAFARNRLRAETRRVANDRPVLVIEPDGTLAQRIVDDNPLASDRTMELVQSTFFSISLGADASSS
jgi:predicted acylesterase/phospholipase RssA